MKKEKLMEDRHIEIMRIENKITGLHLEQNRIVVKNVRTIQAEKEKFIPTTLVIEMCVDENDGYRMALVREECGDPDNEEMLQEIDDMLCDYSFVFGGQTGRAVLEPDMETINLETT